MPFTAAFTNLKLSALMLAEPPLPAVSGWNRLEGRTRERDFERALRAEIRDPMWMLARQWQTGEFQGEDAGTAVEGKFILETSTLTTFKSGNGMTLPYDDSVPLEVRVERETMRFDLFTQVQIGKMWFKLLKAQGLLTPDNSTLYLANCLYIPPQFLEQDYFEGDEEATQFALLTQARMPNGEILLKAIKDGTHATWVNGNANETKLLNLAEQLKQLYLRIYNEPDSTGDDSWKPERLEYQFAVDATENEQQNVRLIADQYYQGHLDWYNFDFQTKVASEVPKKPERVVHSYIPTPVQFYGMPNRRWWTFEDGQTDLGNLNPQTTDIATLLFAEFALVFSNDWQVLPCELPVGSLNKVDGILITDVFGIKTWVRPVGRGLDDDWHQWRMFAVNTEGVGGNLDTRLFLPPSVVKTLESPPLEEVRFIRDEMANMVWGIEHKVASAMGKGKDGYEDSTQLLRYLEETGKVKEPEKLPVPDDDAPPAPTLKYVLGTQVPRNWIPFLPVKIPNSASQIRLQKAAMPEFLELKNPAGYDEIVKSRTTFLASEPYFVNEEEVPRAGAIVKKSFQRTRWYNGKVYTWVGKSKEVGRGEGLSGLAFDQLV